MDDQRASKKAQLECLNYPSEAERAQLVKTIDTQCQIEQDELSYRLSLEQAQHVEKLRKVPNLHLVYIKYLHAPTLLKILICLLGFGHCWSPVGVNVVSMMGSLMAMLLDGCIVCCRSV